MVTTKLHNDIHNVIIDSVSGRLFERIDTHEDNNVTGCPFIHFKDHINLGLHVVRNIIICHEE